MTTKDRRSCDASGDTNHVSPCEKLQLTATIQDQMFAMLEDIQRENAKQSKILDEQKDMFIAWNNTKGFVATMKSVGVLILWLSAIAIAFVAIIHGIRDYLLQGVK